MATRPAKKRKLTAPTATEDDPSVSSKRRSAKIQEAFFKNATTWDLENDYELKARKEARKKGAKENSRLPIRLPDGRLQHLSVPDAPQDEGGDDGSVVVSDTDWLEGAEAPGDDEEAPNGDMSKKDDAPQIPEAQQILEAKEELAKIALMINENPDENAGAFKALAKIGQSRIAAIQKIALATQLAVYKDVIPGYRIRPASEDSAKEKLSKEVRTQRMYEQSLVAGYQAYIREMAKHAKAGRHEGSATKTTKEQQSVASVAITCACTLLTSVPHFNFRTDLIKILLGKLSTKKVTPDFAKCLTAFETLFREDEEGNSSMDAVSLLSKMMRARDYHVDGSVLNLFLHLRLLSEFSGKASRDSVDKPQDNKEAGPKPKQKKKNFRTKRERKEMRERKVLSKDMDLADALVSHEERDRIQSETLKLVFATYFRILKARTPHLMGTVLEGLVKYAHLINQEFFGDLLEALKDLIRYSDAEEESTAAEEEEEENNNQQAGPTKDNDDEDESETPHRNTTRESLLCITTAFALLAGQDAHNARSDLHLDLSFFTSRLYQAVLPLSLHPDLELSSKSLHLPDPNLPASHHHRNKNTKVDIQTTTVLLLRSLTAVLLPAYNARSVPPLRLAAFTKHLLSLSLHVPEKSARGVLALLSDVVAAPGNARKVAPLWHTEERRADGVWNMLAGGPEAANPYAGTAWEGEILRRHFCPEVKRVWGVLEKGVEGGR